MVETHWEGLRGREVRYLDHLWELTGDVVVLESGGLLALEARQTDDVRRRAATLYFAVEAGRPSLNPGNLGEHFDSLERTGGGQYLVVRDDRRTYRYRLQRLEHE